MLDLYNQQAVVKNNVGKMEDDDGFYWESLQKSLNKLNAILIKLDGRLFVFE